MKVFETKIYSKYCSNGWLFMSTVHKTESILSFKMDVQQALH